MAQRPSRDAKRDDRGLSSREKAPPTFAAQRTKPAVIVVGADKGGVGKTTIARALLDYLAANNVLTRAFDTETPR
jgi:Mrp family chromosome partitioning ATPase